ncbi:MAG: anti-sigma factor [Marinibacterium sp.]
MNETGHRQEDDDEALAAEFVIGVLPHDDRQAALRRIREDAGFAQQVAKWERHLDGLNNEYGTLTPPARVKTEIDRRLFDHPRAGWTMPRWIAGALSAMALIAAVMVFVQVSNRAGTDLRADIAGDNTRIEVSVDQDRERIGVLLIAGDPPPESVFELWLVPEADAPVSLGVFTDRGTFALDTTLAPGATLAVSIEPVGGSPTGAPTGPVVAAGTLKEV